MLIQLSSGFLFALNPFYDYVLIGLVVLVFPIFFAILFWKRRNIRYRQRVGAMGLRGYDPEPWRHADPPPAYDAQPPQQVGLTDLNSEGRKERSDRSRNDGLGAEVAPRELL